jgi:hypothetical protein
MNWAFFTFNAVLFAGLSIWQWQLGRRARAQESFRRYLWNIREQLDAEWQCLIRALEIVEGGDGSDPGDEDDYKEKAEIETLERWMRL